MSSKTAYTLEKTENEAAADNPVLEIANVKLDSGSRQAYINARTVSLTAMEFDLLYYLIAGKNRAISRKELLKEVWGFEYLVETRATDDMVKRLRKKLERAGSQLKIATVWGYGFKIEV